MRKRHPGSPWTPLPVLGSCEGVWADVNCELTLEGDWTLKGVGTASIQGPWGSTTPIPHGMSPGQAGLCQMARKGVNAVSISLACSPQSPEGLEAPTSPTPRQGQQEPQKSNQLGGPHPSWLHSLGARRGQEGPGWGIAWVVHFLPDPSRPSRGFWGPGIQRFSKGFHQRGGGHRVRSVGRGGRRCGGDRGQGASPAVTEVRQRGLGLGSLPPSPVLPAPL